MLEIFLSYPRATIAVWAQGYELKELYKNIPQVMIILVQAQPPLSPMP